MSEMINIYKENLILAINKLTKATDNLKNSTLDKTSKFKNDGDNAYNEANKIIKLIEISPSFHDPSLLKEYKKDLAEAKKNFNKTIEESIESKYTTDSKNYSKDKLIEQDEEEAYKQYNKLENSKRTILGIEKSAVDVQKELHNQTETMIKVNSNIGSMNVELDDSHSLVRNMLRREVKNKIALISIVVALVVIFLIILFIKLGGSEDSRISQSGVNKSE